MVNVARTPAERSVPPDMTYHPSPHDRQKKARKAHRRATRRERLRQPDYQPPLPTIVGYGDPDKANTKGSESLIMEPFRAVLARRTLVVLIDGYRTSIVCSVCHERTVAVVHQSYGQPDGIPTCVESTTPSKKCGAPPRMLEKTGRSFGAAMQKTMCLHRHRNALTAFQPLVGSGLCTTPIEDKEEEEDPGGQEG